MKIKPSFSILITPIFLLVTGCATKWTEAIQYGKVAFNDSNQTEIGIEINKNLIFVPVTINGENYKFLFDSGAPLSISKKLQSANASKILSKGNIIDSDHNKTQVNWVRIEALNIGTTVFSNQTAFVADFEANPILSCLNIDGIIGSNLIRQCNWTINQESKTLVLQNNIDKEYLKNSITIPFKTDYQYNIFIDVNLVEVTVKNLLLDFGSNGPISLNQKIFSELKNNNTITDLYLEIGSQQSGIVGKATNMNRMVTFTNSLKIDNRRFDNVLLRTGNTSLIGNSFLSNFRVTIDWTNKNLYLIENEKKPILQGYSSFKLGYSEKKGTHIQSVIEKSDAFKNGLRPNMSVLKIDTLNFERDHNFCDYVNHQPSDTVYMQTINSNGKTLEYHFKTHINPNDELQ